jgi:hypothetical protein
MANTTASEIERLTSAEIARQLAHFRSRRDGLTQKLAAAFAERAAGVSEPNISDREKQSRERARQLLNGHAALLPALKAETPEQELYIERDAYDLLIRTFTSERMNALAREAGAWAKAHADEWREICRDWILSAARFEAAERRAAEFRQREIASYAPAHSFEIMEFVGAGSSIEVMGANLDLATKAAIKQKVVTAAEIKEAQNAK